MYIFKGKCNQYYSYLLLHSSLFVFLRYLEKQNPSHNRLHLQYIVVRY